MKFLNQSLVALLACLPVIWQSVVPLNKTDGNVSMETQDSSLSGPPNVPLSQLQNNNLIDLDAEFLDQLRSERNERLLAKPDESENSFPLDYYIIDQMAKWGFEYFQKELEYYDNRDMRIILNKHFFSYNDFELVCKLIDDSQQDWTELELIRLLEIGVECLASGEVKEKIITTVALGIFEERVRESIVTLFLDFQAEIVAAVETLHNSSVSIENEILQLDGSKILKGNDKIAIVKYFLMRAKTFTNARFINFNFTREIIHQIGEQCKNDSFIFYPNTKQATFCLGKNFGEFEKEVIYSRTLSFSVKKTEIISSSLTAIPDKSLEKLSGFHPQVDKFASNPNVLLSKIAKCRRFIVKGELDAELFEDFYFKMKELIFANVMDIRRQTINDLNLFTSLATKTLHLELFGHKRNIWKGWDEFHLDFTDSSLIPQYETTDFSMKKFDHLLVTLDKNAHLDLLEKAFDNKNIISIHLSFYWKSNQCNQLIGIINEKTFQSLIIDSIYDGIENELKFIDDLVKTPFWNGLKYLNIFSVSLQVISKVLDFLPSNLQALVLELPESSNGEFDSKRESLKYPSVRELNIKAYGNFDCTNDIEQLLPSFPNLERLTVDSYGSLKPFEIKNNQLNELTIRCSKLEEGDKFIEELINSTTLTQGYVKRDLSNIIEWKKHEGRIYYEIEIFKK